MEKEKRPDKIFVSFILIGKDLDPNDVSASLGLNPYKSFKRGDMRTESERWKHGYWEICSAENIDSHDLAIHLEWIVNQLSPINQVLSNFLGTQNVKAKISCFWILEPGQSVLTLSSQLIVRLSGLGTSIEFDIYSDG
jgi:hypothetical protein